MAPFYKLPSGEVINTDHIVIVLQDKIRLIGDDVIYLKEKDIQKLKRFLLKKEDDNPRLKKTR